MLQSKYRVTYFIFFLILSKFEVYLINNYSNEITKSLEDHTIITFEKKFSYENKQYDLVIAPSIDEFLKWIHPSFDILKNIEDYIDNTKFGENIFMSSGSTGSPKLIPLSYEQINNCYLNVKKGFLEKIELSNIVSVHDTSFVIVLPFLFALSCKKNTKLFACNLNASKNSILNLGAFFEKNNQFTIISVPSVYRIILKLFSVKFRKNLERSNLISCGEPLDKILALEIIKNKPKSFFNLYGSTEVSPWIIYLDVKKYLLSFVNQQKVPAVLPAGKPLPNVNILTSGEGELLVNSKSQFSGYLNQDNFNIFKEINSKIYFRTGDLFSIKENYLFCKGRINNSLKIAGTFINPILLEIIIKEKLIIENLLIIPSIVECKLFIVIFSKDLDFINLKNTNKIKNIINEQTSINIPMKFFQNKENINYLRSGKIDRKFYTSYYLEHVNT